MRNDDAILVCARPAALVLALACGGPAGAESPLDGLAIDVLDARESPEQALERIVQTRQRQLGHAPETIERGLLQRLLDEPGIGAVLRDAPRELVALPDDGHAFGHDRERDDDGEDGWGDRDRDDDKDDDDRDDDDGSGEGGGDD